MSTTENLEELVKQNKPNYMLLSRLQEDCNYFLGNGNRHEKHLWAGNVQDHIAKMKELYNCFPEEIKPEWITMKDIEDYEKQMVGEQFVETNIENITIWEKECVKLDEWQNGTATYVLGRDTNNDMEWYLTQTTETLKGFEGTYTQEYDRRPSREDVENMHARVLEHVQMHPRENVSEEEIERYTKAMEKAGYELTETKPGRLETVTFINRNSNETLGVDGWENVGLIVEKLENTEKELEDFVKSHQDKISSITSGSERETLVINAFGGAGAGKTTACLGICEELKKAGYIAEYVQEYAKELVWEEAWYQLDGTAHNQFDILKEQTGRMDRLLGKVDFIVTDAPVLLNKVYNNELTENYEKSLLKLYNQFNNFNFVVERDEKVFETEGRIHNLEQSIEKDSQIQDMLKENNLYFGVYNHETTEKVVQNAIRTLEKLQAPEQAPAQAKDNFQAFAQAKGEKQITLYGESKEEILQKLNAWNQARAEENQFKTCNIRELDKETNRYQDTKKYEVVSGKDITPTYLELPPLPKEEYSQLTAALKENGAKFNSYQKKWYITPEQDLEKIEEVIRENSQKGSEVREKPVEDEISVADIPHFDIDMQYVIDFEDGSKPFTISFKENDLSLDMCREEKIVNFIFKKVKEELDRRKEVEQSFTEEKKELLQKANESSFSKEQVESLKDTSFSKEQILEIKTGIEIGLSPAQVMNYAKAELEPWQMNFCTYGQEHGVPMEQLKDVIYPGKLENDEEWVKRKEKLDELVSGKRNQIAADIKKNGFKPNPQMIKKVERLNHLTKRNNTMRDIANSFKNHGFKENTEAQELVNDLAKEFKAQEMIKAASAEPVMEA